MNEVFSPAHAHLGEIVREAVARFDLTGRKLGSGKRNQVKHLPYRGQELNIKSFRIPNFLNRLVYRFVRKSKARRSFEHALYLRSKGIGTPAPIAYFEDAGGCMLGRTYYVSEHLSQDLSFRTLIEQPDYPGRDEILRQFTRFTHRLHEEGVLFKDHSPGNTLIKKSGEQTYDFFLVDLNRMRIDAALDFEDRMRNFARLSATPGMLRTMSAEYAHITGKEEAMVYGRMQHYTLANKRRRDRQKLINKKLGKYS